METSGDRYNLKWNNHSSNFIQTFVERLNSEALVDVTLSCEGHFIKAHKLVLSACSDYFHNMFKIQEVKHPFIFLNGVKFRDLSDIIHFIYYGQVRVLDKDLPNILALGQSLQIKGLSSIKIRDFPSETPLQATVEDQKHSLRKSPNSTSNNAESDKSVSLRLPIQKTGQLPIKVYTRNNKHKLKNLPSNSRTKIARLTFNKKATNDMNSDANELNNSKKTLTVKVSEVSTTTSSKTPITSPASTEADTPITIPKPPQAFMIFANEWRKKLTIEHPEENNKEISVRLGNMWKNLLPETRSCYYQSAAKNYEKEQMLKEKFGLNQSDVEHNKIKSPEHMSNSHSETIDPLEIVEEVYVSDSD